MNRKRTLDLDIPQNADAEGFSLMGALILVLLIAFILTVVLKLLWLGWAILGFIAAVIVLMIIVSIPDIIRYVRISSM